MSKKTIAAILFLLFLAGCAKQPSDLNKEEKPEVETVAKALFVVAPKNFQPIEYDVPKKILQDAGVKVVTASSEKVATSKTGDKLTVDLLLGEATAGYDAVVFIGGPGASVYFDNEKALSLAREFNKKNKVVAAICIAPSILANAGILEGKRATAFESEQENLEDMGATYTGQNVTVDGNIITGNGPGASQEFAKRILEGLK